MPIGILISKDMRNFGNWSALPHNCKFAKLQLSVLPIRLSQLDPVPSPAPPPVGTAWEPRPLSSGSASTRAGLGSRALIGGVRATAATQWWTGRARVTEIWKGWNPNAPSADSAPALSTNGMRGSPVLSGQTAPRAWEGGCWTGIALSFIWQVA